MSQLFSGKDRVLFQSPSIFPLNPFRYRCHRCIDTCRGDGEKKKGHAFFGGHVLSFALYELPRNEGNSLELVGCGEDYFAEGGVAVNA